MKKIVLGMMALALTFSGMAQTTDGSVNQQPAQGKEFKNKHFKGGENLGKLNLTDDQKAQIKTLNKSFKQQMQDLNKLGNMNADEKNQKRETLIKDHKEKIAAILTPEQKQQAEAFKQEHQGRKDGAREGKFGDLTKDLNLTADQSAKMSSINSSFKTNIQSIRQNASLTNDQKKEQVKSLMKQHKSEVEGLLTDDQKEQLKSRLKNRPNRTAVK